jgi:O-antigen/teichoic acid export membrane protein
VARVSQGVPRSVFSIADQIVASTTTFITGALIGRVCTKEEFGLYTVGFSLLTLSMTLQGSLISTPFMVRYPHLSGDDARSFAGSSLVHQLVFAIAASVLVLIGGAISFFYDIQVGPVFVALGTALAFLLARDYVRQTCFARLAYAQALLLDIMLAAIQMGGLAALYILGTLHTWSAFLVLGAACAFTAVHWFLVTRGDRSYSRQAVVSDFAQNWQSGKWLLASGLVWAVSMNLYAWIVAGFHGAATAGAWAAALGVMTLINPLMLGVQNYLGPRIMHAHAAGGISQLRRVVRGSAFVFCAMLLAFTLLMVFAGDALVTFIYGAKYAGNGTLVVLLSLNATVLTVGFAVSRGLFALERAQIDFYVNFAALASFLVFGIALVRWMGPIGAAVAQLATNVLATSIRAVAFARSTHRLQGEIA